MKKAILYVFLAPLLFFSCSKEHKTTPVITNPGGKTYKVQFHLSGFSEQITSLTGKKQPNSLKTNSADSSNTDSLDILYCLVYNGTTGKYIHKIVIHSDSASFASFSDNLPAGTYFTYFVAGKTGLLIDTVGNKFYYDAPGDSLGDWHDTFFAQTGLTVTGNDNENVTLTRFVSAIKINIADAIPANAVKIVTTIQNDDIYYQYVVDENSGGYYGAHAKTLTTTITPALVGTTNLQQYTIMGYSGNGVDVYISCFDASNNLLGSATIPNIGLSQNRETIISGDLFSHSGTGSIFQVSLNNEWAPNPFTTISF